MNAKRSLRPHARQSASFPRMFVTASLRTFSFLRTKDLLVRRLHAESETVRRTLLRIAAIPQIVYAHLPLRAEGRLREGAAPAGIEDAGAQAVEAATPAVVDADLAGRMVRDMPPAVAGRARRLWRR